MDLNKYEKTGSYRVPVGLKRINFDIPDEVHKRLKVLMANRGTTLKETFFKFIDGLVDGVKLAGEEQGLNPGNIEGSNPGDFLEKLGEAVEAKINEILDLRLIGLNQANNPGVGENPSPGVGEELDEEDKVYQTKSDHESPVKPAVKPAKKSVVKPAKKSVVVEEIVTAENGVIVKGKKVERKTKKPFWPTDF